VVLDIPASATIFEVVASGTGQTQGLIQFPEGQETGVGGDGGAVKFQADSGVELEPEGSLFAVTHRVPPVGLRYLTQSRFCCLVIIALPAAMHNNQMVDRSIWTNYTTAFSAIWGMWAQMFLTTIGDFATIEPLSYCASGGLKSLCPIPPLLHFIPISCVLSESFALGFQLRAVSSFSLK
jgi:hypothetical protein